MTIEILKDLRDYTPINGFANEPISEQQIAILEAEYNDGRLFPKVLRELLFIAGKYCKVLDYGIAETQQKLQSDASRIINHTNVLITRPYYIIDLGPSDFAFLYLDEDSEDPTLFCFNPDSDVKDGPIYSLKQTVFQYINSRLELVKKGYTPY